MQKMTATWAGGMRFVYESATGHGLVTDAPKQAGGLDTAATPMELVLLGLIGCTGVDVSSILLKMKEPLQGLEVSAEYERADSHPKVYTSHPPEIPAGGPPGREEGAARHQVIRGHLLLGVGHAGQDGGDHPRVRNREEFLI